MTMLSLETIKRDLGGNIRHDKTGRHVVAPWPGCRQDDLSLSVWTDGETFHTYSHRGVHFKETNDYVRQKCNFPDWAPTKRRKATRKPKPVPLEVRNAFISETRKICRHRKRISFEMLALLVNDLRLAGSNNAMAYVREFGFGAADLERCLQIMPRRYTADERAAIFQLSYAERQHLMLRRTGSIDVDKQGRERARRERWNARRRALRALARTPGVNREDSKFRGDDREVSKQEEVSKERNTRVEIKSARVQNFANTREGCNMRATAEERTSFCERANFAERTKREERAIQCESTNVIERAMFSERTTTIERTIPPLRPPSRCHSGWGFACQQCQVQLDHGTKRYVIDGQMVCHNCRDCHDPGNFHEINQPAARRRWANEGRRQ